MFTGIVEQVGAVERAAPQAEGMELAVRAGEIAAAAQPGDSVSVNGACLTVERAEGELFVAQVVPETLERTTLGSLRAGDPVNLERPLAAGARLHGHFVQGHVDGVERITQHIRGSQGVRVTVSLARELAPYVAPKGSIAVDGTSLTVVEMGAGHFSFALVPYTMDHTILGRKGPGDEVNVEVDILAKYVRRMLEPQEGQPMDETFLAEHGFLS